MPSTIADKLWTVANTLTMFMVAQAVAYAFAVGDAEFAERINSGKPRVIVTVVGISINLLCGLAIWWCHIASVAFPKKEGFSEETAAAFEILSLKVTCGRLIVVAVFALMSLTWPFMVTGDPAFQ